MRVVAIATAIAMALNLVCGPINVLANENPHGQVVTTAVDGSIKNSSSASVSKFDLYGKDMLNAYNEVFKMSNTNIKSITNNGGNYSGSPIEKAIDSDMNTHWETGRPNSSTFTNEVVIHFNETTTLDRIVYAARQSSAKGKGFAQAFEIYSSTSDAGDDFTLVSSGEYNGSTGDIVEIQFTPTEFKRVKFVFKKANQDWASASEFLFYKEDRVSDKMEKLYTDETLSTVNEAFNTVDAINKLEEDVKNHPLYLLFKEDLENAKLLVENKNVNYVETIVSKFEDFNSNLLPQYDELYKLPSSKITKITANGGQYATNSIERAIDGNAATQWHSGKQNGGSFINEVVMELDALTTLNRIVYMAPRGTNRGFPEAFEIYASRTTKGDTFERVSSGTAKATQNSLEFRFNPTEFKRVKFVFTQGYENWACAGEFGLYKQDELLEKVARLFTDDTMSKVSEEFNTIDKLTTLEEDAKNHPFYENYKEAITNAKALMSEEKIEATTAIVKPFAHYANDAYSKLFRMDYKNIESIRNNGGHYASAVIGNAIDENLTTYWETNKSNSSDFSNEVEVTFKEAVKLNRIMYGARPSDRKGFAEEFEIYASKTSKGDTYELVTTGKHNMVPGLVEAKFEPTTFKRVKFKFKKSNQNWATLSELAFYTEDNLDDKLSKLFTDGTMVAVAPEYNSVDRINALEEEAKVHPLYSTYKEQLDLAKKIINGEIVTEARIIEAEQHGNMVQHANEKLKFGFGSNLQPTGLAAQPGDKIIVYVDAVANGPLPSLSFAQQEGAWNSWRQSVNLKVGKNVITVPEVPKTSYYKKAVTPGGTIYIENPYTKEQQGKTPTLRFEGVDRVPFATKDTNVEEFKNFLIDYKKKIDEDVAKHPNVKDQEVLDVVEVVSDHLFWTGTATGAYKTYIEDGYSPLETIESYNRLMEELFRYYGLDARSDEHDPKLIRENIRLAQPYSYMYAAGDHIGTLDDVVSSILVPIEEKGGSWGVIHEIGHRMDAGVRTYVEVTNNMLPQHMSAFYGNVDNRIPFEANIYKNVLKENAKDYNSQGLFEKLAVFWQIEMYSPGYWGKLNGMYRERNVSLTDGDRSKQQYLVEFSSEALGLDLSEHFARHGFVVSKETRQKTSKYPKPGKIWYLNNSVVDYRGKGIADEKATVAVSINTNLNAKTNTLSFKVDKTYQEDFLGYEIFRDNELIAFTSADQFIDQNVDTSKNYTYKIVGYDKKLHTLKSVEIKAFSPALSVEEHVTLKLYQKFDPMDYVKAISYDGHDITDAVVIKSNNVDVAKKGNYEIVYEINNEGVKETKTIKVTVTSDYKYISDMTAKSVSVGWGSLQKDKSISGGTITLLRQGLNATYSKGIGIHANSALVYEIDGKNFDFFESYIGIDQAVNGQSSSATFEVWVDGEKKFDSSVFKANTEHAFVKVPVTGAKEVKLVTTDADNNGNAADHTIWADAKFTQASSKPTLTISEDFTMVKLNSEFDLLKDVTALDVEDGDLKVQIKVASNGFNTNKTGTYNVEYSVTDHDNNFVTATRKIYVYSDTQFATDTEWKAAQTAWKNVNKDKASSGSAIKLLVNGETKEFAKGIGTHANSEIVYDLERKNYDYFETLVGVDRNIVENSKSSVIFKVLADGQEIYNSGVMNYQTEAKLVRLPVQGIKELKLIASDSGNGNESDHADFADAKFYISNGVPELTIPKSVATKVGNPIDINEQFSALDAEDGDLTSQVKVTGKDQVNFDRAGKYEITYTVVDSDGNELTKKRIISVVNMEDYNYLSDFEWKSTQNSYTAPVKDLSISNNTLRLTGEDGSEKAYQKGIGAHSNSTIIYDLTDKDTDYFTSFVGVDRQMHGSIASVTFQVFVDGENQFDSGLMLSRDPQKFVEVNISGAKELKLVVTDGGNGNGSDHATWGDAKLYFANADRVFRQNLATAIEEAKAINAEGYISGSMDALYASLAKAEELLANKQATQGEIDQAVETLKQTIAALVAIDLNQIITITDKNLKTYIQQTLGLAEEITLGDMYKLTSLNCPSTRITSLEGLQYAKNLVLLDISGNTITDFSPLKDLSKLENVIAHPQIVEVDSLKGPVMAVGNLVKGLDGKYLNPYQIGLRHTKTNKEIYVDVELLAANSDQFTIDLSEEDKGWYMLVFAYKLKEDTIIQLTYYVDNN
ncbi:NPCBM/NEW2 domain-containing protein [Peribacillus loiseleuriae]|uniref:NPCBM/NEW2 domain-containing protein n=1 Tax=Peribacillus loiseleuriae TaxID=1679170 RepID=UPI003814DE85